ncbi:MAG: porphobilinogen synthase [Acidobacteriota bacterium]|uniref:Delta-aminolevulinic acid dehydratase n=1 Tax=Thermoanaerobaculum aquaticum TaxID=1312852 RepID=A0A062XT34_9BACT|nr:porphobilinogen synthase [Thermoanaerobaculum aquaticum]KDA53978.1 delta-aminolevulinic acid dehydratase [Thermoanaerobaculum aquaticum]GBC79035.1 Delta-aminolevulinic acid dehydratase [bacterium HR09]
MSDLVNRPRRLRFNPVLRDLVAEARLDPRLFVMPHFVLRDPQRVEDIAAMPGIQRQGIEPLLKTVESDLKLGIRSVLLFGVPGDDEPKHPDGRGAYDENALIPQAVAALKKRFGSDLLVITDVCLCAYTDHGHCGVIKNGKVANDPTLEHLARMALAHARAGADVVAPSDMMDGRVAAIRELLDEEGFVDTPIMSYSVKYASGYYGPFREAAHSAPQFGDRKSYQMDARNRREALLEAELDVAEGADILMVKPGLAYLDVLRDLKENFVQPVAVYNVSGEYSMVKAAAQRGWIDERAVIMENLHAFRRAGADIIITYHAREVLANGWL